MTRRIRSTGSFGTLAARVAIVAAVTLTASGFAAMPPSQARAGSGDFHVLCNLAHVLPDDPIVRPGQPGASHLHDFFGNQSTDAFSTFGSMAGAGSTCNFAPDTAGYWAPSLISPGGTVVSPVHLTAYYFGQGNDVTAPPPDLRMLAGGDTSNLKASGYACGEGQPTSPVPMNCGGGLDMKGVITFPSCWDGARTDSADHRSHVAYPSGGNCGGNFPVTIPKIVLHVTYGITNGNGYRLSSDANFNTTQGRSLHADFWNTWDQSALVNAVNSCIHTGNSCNLGNGNAPPGSSPDAPDVDSFTPMSGTAGDVVTINGKKFADTVNVTFNGMPASFSVNSNKRLTATVPNGATTGPITVTNPSGDGVSPAQFTVSAPPDITSFDPSTGPVGSSVTIMGTSFNGTTGVQFDGVNASYVVTSGTTITATVPGGATTGKISVINPSGSDNTKASFIVTGTGSVHHRRVSLRLAGELRARGKVIVRDGFMGCVAHVRVKLQWLAMGHGLGKATWRTVGHVRTDAKGKYHAQLHDRSGRYRARLQRTASGTDPCGRATSRVRRHHA